MSSISESSANSETVAIALKRGVTHWRIYYGDGSHVDSSNSTWEDCQDYDVQVVVQFRLSPSGDRLMCEMMSGDDHYYLEGHDRVKYGEYAEWSVYDEIFTRASEYKNVEYELYQDLRRSRGERGD